ncbi:TPA: CLC_0170 family protein [Clostridioides difficile]
MSKFIEIFKEIFDNFTLFFIIFIGLAILLIDGPRMKNKEFTRELTIVRIISYSYMIFGIIIFIILRIV